MNKIPKDQELAVDRFAHAMKTKLAIHVGKGDWSDVSFHTLMDKAMEELKELAIAHASGNTSEVMLEAADVALSVMMAADVANGCPRPNELRQLRLEVQAAKEGR